MTEISCKSYVTYSILFSNANLHTVNTTRIGQPAEYVSDEIIVHRGASESCVRMKGTLANLISPWHLIHLT